MKCNLPKWTAQTCLIILLTVTLIASVTPTPEKLELILLIGQSNMAGRGELMNSSGDTNLNIWAMNAQNEWVVAKDPVHFDKPKAVGVGPGLAFAQELVRSRPNLEIGLIPCAVGGSGIDDWQPSSKHEQTGIYPYDVMLKRVRAAQKYGKIKAILWHQGESDSSPEKSKVYEAKLAAFFTRLRQDIKAPKTPILLGTLGDFYVNKNPNGQIINDIMTHYASTHKNVFVVASAGLTDKGDTTHFDAKSAQELGRRYAKKLLEIKVKK